MNRPEELTGITRKLKTVCGTLYITLNTTESKLSEVFLVMGKSGTCARAMVEIIGRLMSIAIKKDADIRKIIKSLKGIRCHDANGDQLGCADAVCFTLEKFLEEKKEIAD